jgi:hypothetical protein
MFIMLESIGIISHVMPLDDILQSHFAMTQGIDIVPPIIGIIPEEQQHMAMPPQVTVHGIPQSIMVFI